MKINLIKLFLLLALTNISLCKEKEYSLSLKQKKYINQAKSLESTGLIDEAKDIYKKLLKDYPYMDEAFNALKRFPFNNPCAAVQLNVVVSVPLEVLTSTVGPTLTTV